MLRLRAPLNVGAQTGTHEFFARENHQMGFAAGVSIGFACDVGGSCLDGAFDGFPTDKTMPFQRQFPLSHGARLLIQGTETCGGMDGDCSTRARLQTEWASGGVETVASDFTFDSNADSFELRKGARSWELRCRVANWSRSFRRGVWTRAGS